MGSAAFDFPGSLNFGGYDKGRLLGPVVTFGDNAQGPFLQDITIGVADGIMPVHINKFEGLLIDSDGNNRGISAYPESFNAYLSLPKQTCDKLASVLPVKYDSSGYYLWDTDNPDYARIIQSPMYLGFVFPPSGSSTEQTVIKLPFALLNLTLDPILSGSSNPIAYFPCQPYEPDEGTGYILGRAFLQAAFWGRNWNAAVSWLAQAPGPGVARDGLGYYPFSIEDSQTTLDTLDGDPEALFNSTWNSFWRVSHESPTNKTNVSGENSNNSTNSNDNSSKNNRSLSIGATAGIGVGAGLGGAILLAILAFFIWRKRRNPIVAQANEHEGIPSNDILSESHMRDQKDASPPYSAVDLTKQQQSPNTGVQNQRWASELEDRQVPQELSSDSTPNQRL